MKTLEEHLKDAPTSRRLTLTENVLQMCPPSPNSPTRQAWLYWLVIETSVAGTSELNGINISATEKAAILEARRIINGLLQERATKTSAFIKWVKDRNASV